MKKPIDHKKAERIAHAVHLKDVRITEKGADFLAVAYLDLQSRLAEVEKQRDAMLAECATQLEKSRGTLETDLGRFWAAKAILAAGQLEGE